MKGALTIRVLLTALTRTDVLRVFISSLLLKARRASDESPTFDPDRYSLKE